MVKVFEVSCIDELICEADEFDTDLEPDYQRGYDHGWNNALYALKESAQAVDAVPVVRCKDCKFNRNAKTFVNEQNCMIFERSMKEDGYCSFGSKRGKYDHS